MIDDFAIIAFIFLYNFDLMKIRISSSHIMISFLLSSWSYNLINLAFIDRSLFIDRFNQFSWESRYLRNLRIKLFSNRERFVKSHSTYSISSALTRNVLCCIDYIVRSKKFLDHCCLTLRIDLKLLWIFTKEDRSTMKYLRNTKSTILNRFLNEKTNL